MVLHDMNTRWTDCGGMPWEYATLGCGDWGIWWWRRTFEKARQRGTRCFCVHFLFYRKQDMRLLWRALIRRLREALVPESVWLALVETVRLWQSSLNRHKLVCCLGSLIAYFLAEIELLREMDFWELLTAVYVGYLGSGWRTSCSYGCA